METVVLRTLLVVLSVVAARGQCPACTCEESSERPGSIIINCAYQSRTQVPTFTPSSFQYYELTLVGNQISSLPGKAFSGIIIEKLDLSQNIISSIADNAFQGLQNPLKTLLLHTNGMTTFPTIAVNNLTNLETFSMTGFYLPQMPFDPFRELRKLRELTITDCSLDRLDSGVFSNQANTLTTLDLNKNKFQTIPKQAIAQVNVLQTLDMQENRLESLKAEAFMGSTLTSLDLSQNGFITIDNDAFKGLEVSLQYLTMKSCNLLDQKLPPLQKLVNLKELVLDNNNIYNIGTYLLDNMNKLEYFSAQSNAISGITDQMFQGTGATLERLNLESNRINSIANPFGSLRSLKELHLGHQNITPQFLADTLASQQNTLEVLDLKDTGFTDSKWNSVNNLRALEMLTLTQNKITAIPDNNFIAMKKLVSLFIDNNQLTIVKQESLFGTQNSLNYINFNDNGITTLSHCTFHLFNINIYSILLNNNPLMCDCKIKWLREKYENERDSALDIFLNWRCAGPPNHSGKLFKNVPIDDFVCSPSVSFPPCQDLTPTTTSTTTPVTPSTTTTPEPLPLTVNITDITDTTILVTWTVSGVDNLQGFIIEYFVYGSGTTPNQKQVGSNARQTRLTGLASETKYIICVEMLLDSNSAWDQDIKICDSAETKEQGQPIVGQGPELGIIIGAVVGGIALVAVIIIVAIFLVRRHKKDQAQPSGDRRSVPFSFGANGLPKPGNDSKRFSKPKTNSQNAANAKIDHVDGFTAAEREKILKFFRQSGGSTLSMISTGSGPRYVPDPMAAQAHRSSQQPMQSKRPGSLLYPSGALASGPALPPRPQEAEGYLNPVMLRDTSGYLPMDTNVYSEIPADGAYEEIPDKTISPDSFV